MASTKEIILGTRDSDLAMVQAIHVRNLIQNRHPDITVEVRAIKTTGDRVLDIPLSKFSDKGVFSKELDIALANGEIDFAVHCVKDLTTTLPPGLAMACVLPRGSKEDCVLMHPRHKGKTLADLGPGSIIGTSSVRRCAILNKRYPFIKTKSVRGNLQLRYKKLLTEDYDGIILALAGIERLNWNDKISQVLSQYHFPYAVGQGALGIVCREVSKDLINLFSEFQCQKTLLETVAERALLCKLEGGCKLPLGINTIWNSEKLELYAMALAPDGTEIVDCYMEKKLKTSSEAEMLGVAIAENLLLNGAEKILKKIRTV